MEIICSSEISVQLEEEVYQNTRVEVFKLARLDERRYLGQEGGSVRRVVVLNEDIVKIAAEILSNVQHRQVSEESDLLSASVLKYFNQIYALFKNMRPSDCAREFRVVDLGKLKLECFKRLLHLKDLELAPHRFKA